MSKYNKYRHKARMTHRCLRCGFIWRGYRRKPVRCGNRLCSSPYWNTPRRVSEEVKDMLASLKFKKEEKTETKSRASKR